MVNAIPYLAVPNAKEALELYKKTFDIEVIGHMAYSKEMGEQMGFPKDFDYENSTMHSEFNLAGGRVYMADDNSGKDAGVQKIDVLLEIDSKEQIENFYNNAKKNGFEVVYELEKTFWGAWFARLVDPFGIGWQMNFQEDSLEQ
jgi:PhnB protein